MKLCTNSENSLVAPSLPNDMGGRVEPWQELERHFRHHALVVRRFEHAGASAVLEMLTTGQNEFGEPLSTFDREALAERHCELFGTWPA
jgi:hypothetical protein